MAKREDSTDVLQTGQWMIGQKAGSSDAQQAVVSTALRPERINIQNTRRKKPTHLIQTPQQHKWWTLLHGKRYGETSVEIVCMADMNVKLTTPLPHK